MYKIELLDKYLYRTEVKTLGMRDSLWLSLPEIIFWHFHSAHGKEK